MVTPLVTNVAGPRRSRRHQGTASHRRAAAATVVVADRQAIVRQGVCAVLRAEGMSIVGESGTRSATAYAVRTLQPDLLVTDLDLDGGFGLAELPGLKEAAPATSVLVLTMRRDPGFVREALAAGGRGYISKDAGCAELVAAARVLMEGGMYLDACLGASLAMGASPVGSATLSARECDVLSLIASGFTNSETADHLFICLRTVEAHRASIKAKLGLSSRAQLSAYAREHGLLVASGMLSAIVHPSNLGHGAAS